MDEKKIINEYFNRYYSRNKTVQNEEILLGFGVAAFLYFLFFIFIKSFTNYDYEKIESNIEKNPKLPEQIIKYLDQIKEMIRNDIKDKKLDSAFNYIDVIDNLLNKFKSTPEKDKKNLIDKVCNNIINLLEEILKLYIDQDDNKKENIFNRIKLILRPFGLEQKFESILKDILKKKKNVVTNDKGEDVKVNPDEVIETINLSPEEAKEMLNQQRGEDQEDQEDQEEEEEDDSFLSGKIQEIEKERKVQQISNLSDIPDEEEEDEDEMEEDEDEDDEEERIAKEEKERQDKLKYFSNINNLNVIVKTYAENDVVLNLILKNIDKEKIFDEDQIINFYDILHSGKSKDEIKKLIANSEIYDIGIELLQDNEKENNIKSLIEFLDSKNLAYKFEQTVTSSARGGIGSVYVFEMLIDKEKFSVGIIQPLKESSNFSDGYLLQLIRSDITGGDNRLYNIYISSDQKDSYSLTTDKIKFSFESMISQVKNVKICTGAWNYSEDKKAINFTTVKFMEGFEPKEQKDKKTYTYILKKYNTYLEEIKSASFSHNNEYYYCIEIPEDETKSEYFIKKIGNNFDEVLKELNSNKKFEYYDRSGAKKIKIIDDQEIKTAIFSDSVKGSKHNFLSSVNYKDDPTEGEDINSFHLVHHDATLIEEDKIKINMISGWYYHKQAPKPPSTSSSFVF